MEEAQRQRSPRDQAQSGLISSLVSLRGSSSSTGPDAPPVAAPSPTSVEDTIRTLIQNSGNNHGGQNIPSHQASSTTTDPQSLTALQQLLQQKRIQQEERSAQLQQEEQALRQLLLQQQQENSLRAAQQQANTELLQQQVQQQQQGNDASSSPQQNELILSLLLGRQNSVVPSGVFPNQDRDDSERLRSFLQGQNSTGSDGFASAPMAAALAEQVMANNHGTSASSANPLSLLAKLLDTRTPSPPAPAPMPNVHALLNSIPSLFGGGAPSAAQQPPFQFGNLQQQQPQQHAQFQSQLQQQQQAPGFYPQSLGPAAFSLLHQQRQMTTREPQDTTNDANQDSTDAKMPAVARIEDPSAFSMASDPYSSAATEGQPHGLPNGGPNMIPMNPPTVVNSERFPVTLFRMLVETERDGLDHVISFAPSGAAFEIHQPDVFEAEILARYFHHGKLNSFKRQLNLYGFRLLSHGPDAGAYSHPIFHRNDRDVSERIRRLK